MPISNEIIVSGFMALSPRNKCVLQYVKERGAQVGQEIDDCAGVRQKLFYVFVPDAEAVELDEAAGLGYGLHAGEVVVRGTV